MPVLIEVSHIFPEKSLQEFGITIQRSGKAYILTNKDTYNKYHKLKTKKEKQKFIIKTFFPSEYNSDDDDLFIG